MALKACRECGKEVSTEARTCPHCGVKDPTGSLAAMQKATGRGCLLATMVVVAIFTVAAYFGSKSSSSGSVRQPVFIGHRAVFTEASPGCPEKADLSHFASDFASAESAHDNVGASNAWATAAAAGCVLVPFGATGLAIDVGGFLDTQYSRVRLDDGGVAYWTYQERLKPDPNTQ